MIDEPESASDAISASRPMNVVTWRRQVAPMRVERAQGRELGAEVGVHELEDLHRFLQIAQGVRARVDERDAVRQ